MRISGGKDLNLSQVKSLLKLYKLKKAQTVTGIAWLVDSRGRETALHFNCNLKLRGLI